MTGYIEAIEARLHRMEGLLGGLVRDKDPRAEIVRAELDAMAREAELTGLKLRRSKAYEEIHNVCFIVSDGSFSLLHLVLETFEEERRGKKNQDPLFFLSNRGNIIRPGCLSDVRLLVLCGPFP